MMMFKGIGLVFLSLALVSCVFAVDDVARELEEDARRNSMRWNRESLVGAAEQYLIAAERRIRVSKHANAIDDLRESARLFFIANESKRADATIRRALTIARDSGLGDSEARVRCDIIRWQFGLGDGSTKIEDIRAIEKIRTADSSTSALIALTFGDFFAARQELNSSIEYYLRAIQLLEQSGDRRTEAEARISLGFSLNFTERDSDAQVQFLRAVELAKQIPDERSETLAGIGLAYLKLENGDRQGGLELLLAIERSFPSGVDSEQLGAAYNAIAATFEEYNALAEAANYRRKALVKMTERGSEAGIAVTLWSLGRLERMNGRFDDARDAIEDCIAIAGKIRNSVTESVCRAERGFINLESNRLEEAGRDFSRSAAQARAESSLRIVIWALMGSGLTKKRLGDNVAGREHFVNSLEIARQIHESSSIGENLYQLALLSAADNQYDDALKLMRESIEVSDSLAYGVVNDRLRTAFVSSIYDRYEFCIGLLSELHRSRPDEGFDVEALRVSENAKARVLRETLAIAGTETATNVDPELVRRETDLRQSLNSSTDRLAQLVPGTDGYEKDRREIQDSILERKLELNEIRAQIRSSNPEFSALRDPEKFEFESFRDRFIDADSVVLEFFLGEHSSFLWVVRTTDLEIVILPGRKLIAAKVESLRREISEREKKSDDTIESLRSRREVVDRRVDETAAALSEILLGSVRDKLAGKRLIVIPDGELHYYPIGALPFPGSPDREPIVATNEVVYQHSIATLRLMRQRSALRRSSPNSAIVFSDPVFDSTDERFNGAFSGSPETGSSLKRLAGAGEESNSIGRNIGHSRVEIRTGFEATRDGFMGADLSRFRVIHLATHGFADSRRPELSGIAFSKFDRDGNALDNLLRLNDLYGLKLNADLVILSACETGLGDEIRGEGLESISNGFIASGARAVVASLWNVEDEGAKLLMTKFYEELASDNLRASDALRRAQNKLRKDPQYHSPYFWAAFTIQGDPESRPRLSRSTRFDYFLPLLVPVFLGLLWYLRRLKSYSVRKS